jgi:hypothetical protein
MPLGGQIRALLERASRGFGGGRGRSSGESRTVEADSLGLDAFASETAAAPPPAGRIRAKRPLSATFPVLLAALVLVQAVPTWLWLRERLSTAAVAAPPPAAAPAPEPADVSPVPAAEAPAPTSGVTRPRDARTEPRTAPPPRSEERRAPSPAAAPPAPILAAGLLVVDAPVPMQILQRGRVVGTTESAETMLPPGTHDLEFVSDAVGHRVRRSVTLQAGRTTRLQIEAPSGTLHVNALPWAEVWIDNVSAGETPIGNFRARIGTREVVFRHPELGERRTTVLVTLKEPARVSVDMRTP